MNLAYQFASKSTYTYKRKVGSGGSAEVFLYSRQTEGLPTQDIALKVLKAADEASVRELLNEGRRLGMLKHPNILATFGYEKIDDRKFGLVLEYFPGENLKSLIPKLSDEQRGPVAEYVIKTIGDALALAHSQEIIHGDLSGRNILISQQGQLKLSDFGLACKPSLQGDAKLGHIKGSADYMAPERWRGESPSISSDVFSLGVLAFEILNGNNPLSSQPKKGGLVRSVDFLEQKLWKKFPLWKEFFDGCMILNPSKRISTSQIVKLIPRSGQSFVATQQNLEGLINPDNNFDRLKTETQFFSQLFLTKKEKLHPQTLRRLRGLAAGFFILFLMAPGAIGQDHSTSGRLKPCQLTLTSFPWGEVFIDGVSRGFTPFINFPVASGAHVVVWKNSQNETMKRTLMAFENGTLAYKISRERGRLRVAPLASFHLMQP